MTPLGQEDQSASNVSEEHNKEGDPTDLFNPNNIIHPTMIDQLPEDLRKMVEEKNATNLQAALAICSLDL